MTVIYEPKGRAREYCELAINLYKGCVHGCTYCFAPAATFTSIEVFRDPKPKLDVILNLEKEAKTGAHKGKEVFLCFSCDPYQPIDDEYQLTRQAIKILHANGMKVRILTKSGYRSERDFDLLAAKPNLSFYGATLTFASLEDSRLYEPESAQPHQRIGAIRKAHEMGIPTWVSLEPVIDPTQTLDLIHATHDLVDVYKVGKWNHSKEAAKINWRKFREEAVELLEHYGKDYYIKEDLRNV